MPHYPEDIDYSEKYCDEHYEYRHVLLPKDLYKKLPKNKLLTESVCMILLRNGEPLGSNSLEAGATMNSTSLSPTSCCLGDRLEPTPPLDNHLPISSLQWMSSYFDLHQIIIIQHSYLESRGEFRLIYIG